jgi:hypothetical protein
MLREPRTSVGLNNSTAVFFYNFIIVITVYSHSAKINDMQKEH